jgi:Holliday junction resolvasome RuvABC endonuclease subunit
MNLRTQTATRVLALDPYSRGVGFVVLEGPAYLIDWGLKEARRDKHTRSLRDIEQLIKTYAPDALVIETVRDPQCRRCQRVRELLRDISLLAVKKKLPVRSFSRQVVRATFAENAAVTKYHVMNAIILH